MNGKLTLHFLPGYAPELNPDELVWSHVKRINAARRPLQKEEKLEPKIRNSLSKFNMVQNSSAYSFSIQVSYGDL